MSDYTIVSSKLRAKSVKYQCKGFNSMFNFFYESSKLFRRILSQPKNLYNLKSYITWILIKTWLAEVNVIKFSIE